MATADATNSFATVSEADAYFATRLHSSAWEDADSPDKDTSLIQSTRLLSTYLEWIGGVPAFTDVDARIKQATFEMALVILAEDKQAVNDLDGISSLTINGVMSLQVSGSGATKMIPSYIQAILGGLITGTFGAIEIVRG